MPRSKALPQDPVVAYVERLTHDGRGIAYVDGKAVFIDQALPGETVRFGYTDIRRDYACGRVIEILSPSSQRVSPPCPHFGSCGGCSLQHLEPAAQLAFKQELLLEQLRRIGKVEPCEVWPPISGEALGYRRKARLGVHWAATRGRTQIGFRRRGSSRIAELDVCLALHPQIGERIKELANLLDKLSIRAEIPQIEVAIGDNRSALVFRILERVSEKDTQALVAFGQKFEFDIYLQPQGPDSLFPLVPENPPLPCYRLPEGVALWFSPLDFTQINAEINRRMIERAVELLEPCSEDIILDLFCGVGNFTLPLARRAGKVVGVEGNRLSVVRARENARANKINNIVFHGCDLTQDLTGYPWARERYDKILLDPSRAGAFELLAVIPRWQPKRIVYISCNPATLARDLGYLVRVLGYRLQGVGILDMFPHTAHVESVALLLK